jgi:hypothetical protein
MLLATAFAVGNAPAAADQSLGDPEVTPHVEQALLFGPATPVASMDLRTGEGIVSLAGRLSSLLAKQCATLTAASRGANDDHD